MRPDELYRQVQALPPEERLVLIRRLIQALHRNDALQLAADALAADYRDDEELTCFTCIEHEYEEGGDLAD